ncbi:MAG: histone deacetylase [Flammeovirgaceae bacterium]|nr:histone deacetylase [Flammeovirgaceae bacterium]|tara:strand:- start:2288 stop:3190 length:903 start_codon:yes stop_codon:yes gene_type:complete
MLKIAFSSIYAHSLPENHRFPMLKYELLPQQLLHEGIVTQVHFFEPRNVSVQEIVTVHQLNYWRKLASLTLSPAEIRAIGFPLSTALIDREIKIAGGTIQCAEYALTNGIAMNIAGGTHHAFSDRGEGFCLLNDQAIAAHYLLSKKHVQQVLIVDLDVHQGNGTAKIFSNNPMVYTFSMHGDKNYPIRKEQSDLDVDLSDGSDDEVYLKLLQMNLFAIFSKIKPDFIFYQAGVDVLETDHLGRLSLSKEGCKERDKMVLSAAREHGIPIVVCMGGGYSPNIRDIIDAHTNTFKLAQELFF